VLYTDLNVLKEIIHYDTENQNKYACM